MTIGTAEGGNCLPFSCSGRLGYGAFQQAYAASSFSGFGKVLISSFKIFRNAPGTLETSTYKLSFSTSRNPVGSLSTTYANNVGPDSSVFGTYNLGGAIQPITDFVGTTPFLYDPAAGDLLLNVEVLSAANDGNAAYFVSQLSNSSLLERVFGPAPVGYLAVTSGSLVTEFTFEKANLLRYVCL